MDMMLECRVGVLVRYTLSHGIGLSLTSHVWDHAGQMSATPQDPMKPLPAQVDDRSQSVPSALRVVASALALARYLSSPYAASDEPAGLLGIAASDRNLDRAGHSRHGAHPKRAGAVGDETLVHLLIEGRDVIDAALMLIRHRFPGKSLRFIPPDQTPDAAPGAVATVAAGGRVRGWLQSHDIPAGHLVHQAAWLASWLAMRDLHWELREAAFIDPLTGAHNRRFFDCWMRIAMVQAHRQDRQMTVLVFDIDDFKYFNDEYGHSAGDDILREIVRLLLSMVRPSDRVCRIGGDEFAVIFDDPKGPRSPISRPPSSVHQIAQRFQRAIAEHRFPKLGREAPGKLTISGGLAAYPADGQDAESLLARADQLALLSKRIGKNCISLGPAAESERDRDPAAVARRCRAQRGSHPGRKR